MAKKKDSAYPVGYRKPPQHTQFKPGQSGNPNGRPKRGKDLATVLGEELRASVTVTENGRRKKISKLRAIAKQHINKAVSGDSRAAAMVLDEIRRRGDPNAVDPLDDLLQEMRRIHREDENQNE